MTAESAITYLKERLTSLPDLLASFFVNILLADMGSPLSDYFLLKDIGLIERHKNLGDGRNKIGVIIADEAFKTT